MYRPGLFVALVLAMPVAWPQGMAVPSDAVDAAQSEARPAGDAVEGMAAANARRRSLAIILGNSLGVALYGSRKWWDDGLTAHFRTQDEGWFGQHTPYGGADKLGHFYFNYASARLFVHAFRWAGNEPRDARALAAWLTLGTFAAVEVIDGFSKKWRFSRQDALMNVAGVGAAWLLEAHPQLDQLVDLRFQYRPSRERGQGADPFGDYSGQTYLIAFKGSGIPAFGRHPWLRYVELSAGYGTRGYLTLSSGEFATRKLYFGISLNLSELLNRTVFRDAQGVLGQRVTTTALEFVQPPGTAALASRRLPRD
jgi:hypothetical protein